jgi:hypothetical protein
LSSPIIISSIIISSIVIAVIPIPFGAPSLLVFIPPPVTSIPAPLPLFAQFVAGAFCLPAVAAVMLDCLVQSVVRSGHTLPAVVILGSRARHSRAHDKSGYCYQRQAPFSQEHLAPSMSHIIFFLLIDDSNPWVPNTYQESLCAR